MKNIGPDNVEEVFRKKQITKKNPYGFSGFLQYVVNIFEQNRMISYGNRIVKNEFRGKSNSGFKANRRRALKTSRRRKMNVNAR